MSSADGKAITAALNWIKSIASDPEIGQIYQGTVVKAVDFGAFVNFFGAKDGLVHISQLAPGPRRQDYRRGQEGDKVWVKLLGFDERGKVRLSMKVVDQATGKELQQERAEPPASFPRDVTEIRRPGYRPGLFRLNAEVARLPPASPWDRRAHFRRNTSGEFHEVLREHVGKLRRLAVVGASVRPRLPRLQQAAVDARHQLRHVEAEYGISG